MQTLKLSPFGLAAALAVSLIACGDDSGPTDECAKNKDDCVDGATCTDTAESFTCTCAQGFTGDGRTSGTGCANLDECALGTDDCVESASCADNDGSYSCGCAQGFAGDGRASGSGCADVDECSASTAVCDSTTSVCANLEGSYQCRSLYAPSPFQNHVYRIDPVTYQVLETIDPTMEGETPTGCVAFAEDPTDGAVYAVVKLTTGRVLARFDAASAVYTQIAALDDRYASITFDSAGQLYAVTGNGATTPETLFRLDKASGAASLVRALGAGADGEVIAYNPEDGKLYHWSGGTSFYETISLTDPYDVTPLSSTFNREVFGAWWNPTSHDFFVFDIASAGRRFFVDGTFEASDLVSGLPDDLRSPAYAPTLPHTVSPASGDVAGGVMITLEGSGFNALAASLGAGAPTVAFGAATATGAIVDDHHLTVTLPAGLVTGPVDVTVSSGSYRYLWRQAFTYTGTLP